MGALRLHARPAKELRRARTAFGYCLALRPCLHVRRSTMASHEAHTDTALHDTACTSAQAAATVDTYECLCLCYTRLLHWGLQHCMDLAQCSVQSGHACVVLAAAHGTA